MKDLLNQKSEIVISCLPELGKSVSMELKKHGFPVKKEKPTAVVTEGTLLDTYFLNLWLRTASHIYYKLSDFDCRNPDKLYKAVKKIEWEEWIPVQGYFTVDSFVRNDSIRDNRFANLRVKDAIADRFLEKFDKRPDSGPLREGVVVYLQWAGNEAAIYVDTSGNTLSKRGYRFLPGSAPLAESLAAALIFQTGYHGEQPFLNPMCGSGTLAIEAAMIACNIAPGYYRSEFAFQQLIPYDANHYKSLRQGLKTPRESVLNQKIYASDIKRKAVSEAGKNIEKAGLTHLIELQTGDFRKTPVEGSSGIIIMNPPYGLRLDEIDDLEKLYSEIGDFFKNKCINYIGYVFTGNLDVAKSIGLRSKSRTIFYNAKLECRLLEYEIFKGSIKNNS